MTRRLIATFREPQVNWTARNGYAIHAAAYALLPHISAEVPGEDALLQIYDGVLYPHCIRVRHRVTYSIVWRITELCHVLNPGKYPINSCPHRFVLEPVVFPEEFYRESVLTVEQHYENTKWQLYYSSGFVTEVISVLR